MAINRIDPTAPAYEVSLNTVIPVTINANKTGDDFNKYLNELLPALFSSREVFTWISLLEADTSTVEVFYELVTADGQLTNHKVSLNQGMIVPTRGLRILSSTNTNVVLNVGARN